MSDIKFETRYEQEILRLYDEEDKEIQAYNESDELSQHDKMIKELMKGEEGTELDSKVHNIGIENTQVSVKIIPSCTINCLRDYPFPSYMKDYRNLNHVYLEGYKDGNLKMHYIGIVNTVDRNSVTLDKTYKIRGNRLPFPTSRLIIVPCNLDLSFLPKTKIRFKTLYVLHSIISQSELDKHSTLNGYVNLNMATLRELLGTRYAKTVINDLREKGIIEVNDTYSAGNFSKSYRLSKVYREAMPTYYEEPFPDKYVRKSKDTTYKEIESCDLVKRHYESVCQIEIDREKALDFVDKLTVNSDGEPLTESGRFQYKHAINRIADKDFFIVKDRTGRIHHNITNLPRALRQFLSYEGKPFCQSDVACSQPTIFIKLIEDYLTEFKLSHTEDTKLFKQLCEGGVFYEYMMRELNVTKDRGKFKVEFFAKIFYSKGTFEYKEARVFKELFPTVYEIIKHYKRNNHADLALLLQKIEADLITTIDTGNDFSFTVHDSLVSLEEHLPKMGSLIYQAFRKVNINPTIKTGVF